MGAKSPALKHVFLRCIKKCFFLKCDWKANSLIVIVLVHGSVSGPGLGSSGSLGHDDLIHAKDGAGGIGGVPHGPVLERQQVVNLSIRGVDGQTGALDLRVFLKPKKREGALKRNA